MMLMLITFNDCNKNDQHYHHCSYFWSPSIISQFFHPGFIGELYPFSQLGCLMWISFPFVFSCTKASDGLTLGLAILSSLFKKRTICCI